MAVAKAGGSVNFISKIGDDQYGKLAIEMYKESKVNYDNVIISKEVAKETWQGISRHSANNLT